MGGASAYTYIYIGECNLIRVTLVRDGKRCQRRISALWSILPLLSLFDLPLVLVDSSQLVVQHGLQRLTGYGTKQDTRSWREGRERGGGRDEEGETRRERGGRTKGREEGGGDKMTTIGGRIQLNNNISYVHVCTHLLAPLSQTNGESERPG